MSAACIADVKHTVVALTLSVKVQGITAVWRREICPSIMTSAPMELIAHLILSWYSA